MEYTQEMEPLYMEWKDTLQALETISHKMQAHYYPSIKDVNMDWLIRSAELETAIERMERFNDLLNEPAAEE